MSGWVTVAWIVRPRGVRGEVVAIGARPDPTRLFRLPRLFLQPQNRPVELEAAWEHRGRWVLKFKGVDTPEQAEALRGAELAIPDQDRPPPPPGEYYISDLIGCRIEDSAGVSLGEVAGCAEYGGPMLLEVRAGDKELLIPFVPAICRIVDIEARRITVDLPEGLTDL